MARLDAEITELQGFVRSRQELSDADMQQLNVKLAHVAEEVNVRMARTLNQTGEELAHAVNALASAKMENEYLAVAKQLDDVESQLAVRGYFAISLADEIAYLNEMEISARVVFARLGDEAMAHRLAERGEELMARGMSNIAQEFQLQDEMAARFKDMDDQVARASRIIGSEATMASHANLAKELGETEQALNAAQAEFRARSTAMAAEEIAAARSLDNNLAGRAELLQKLGVRQAP